MTYDAIIIGGGLAGLTTAARLAELGKRPLVLEQGEGSQYPCNSRFAGGIVHIAQKDIAAPAGEIQAAIDALTGGAPETSLSPVMAAEGGRALQWLRGQGAKFVKGGALEFMRWVLAPPRPRRPGLDWKGRGPDVLLRTLTARLETLGGTIERGAWARKLILDGGRVAGVVADRGGRSEGRHAGAVVIADGGFQGNPDLVRRHISPRPEALFTRGAGTGRGDGLTMAEAAGARLVGMDRFYGHLLGREVFDNEKLWPYPTVDAIASVSILVGGDGQRFADEGIGGVYMANELAKRANPLDAVVVFDEKVWTGIAADNRYPPCMNPSFVSEGGTVHAAATLAELAAMTGLPADRLDATVKAYNAAVAAGCTSTLTPLRSAERIKPLPIAAPPFRAIEVCAGITYTMGGIAIDRDSRVLRREAEGTIDGLFAAGSATGGAEGGPRAAYLGGLAKAAITGLRAAETIAG